MSSRYVIVLRRVEDFHQTGTGPDFTETELTLDEFADLFEWGVAYETVNPSQGLPYQHPRNVLRVRDEAKARFG